MGRWPGRPRGRPGASAIQRDLLRLRSSSVALSTRRQQPNVRMLGLGIAEVSSKAEANGWETEVWTCPSALCRILLKKSEVAVALFC